MAKKSVNAKYEARNKKMRADYKKETGNTLGKRHTSGKDKARISFACRFAGMKGSMVKDNGEPSNYAMALKKWGFSSRDEASKFCQQNKKSKLKARNKK
tara:strand:+ start:403 stop:699 length:297 start_codon:yes stop_codon:yes gene_type:complete